MVTINPVHEIVRYAKQRHSTLQVILGPAGSGKSTVCKLVTDVILRECDPEERFRANPDHPTSVYLDLLDVVDIQKKWSCKLEELLEEMLRKPGETCPPGTYVIQYVQEKPTVITYDHFDLATNALIYAERFRLYKTLLGIVPKMIGRDDSQTHVVLPLRREVFRSNIEENTFLSIDGSIPSYDIHKLTLLPFTDEQIVDYLFRDYIIATSRELTRESIQLLQIASGRQK